MYILVFTFSRKILKLSFEIFFEVYILDIESTKNHVVVVLPIVLDVLVVLDVRTGVHENNCSGLFTMYCSVEAARFFVVKGNRD